MHLGLSTNVAENVLSVADWYSKLIKIRIKEHALIFKNDHKINKSFNNKLLEIEIQITLW